MRCRDDVAHIVVFSGFGCAEIDLSPLHDGPRYIVRFDGTRTYVRPIRTPTSGVSGLRSHFMVAWEHEISVNSRSIESVTHWTKIRHRDLISMTDTAQRHYFVKRSTSGDRMFARQEAPKAPCTPHIKTIKTATSRLDTQI